MARGLFGVYRLWYFSHSPLKDFAGCYERLSVPSPWVCTLSTMESWARYDVCQELSVPVLQ